MVICRLILFRLSTSGGIWLTLLPSSLQALTDWVPLAYFIFNLALVYRAPLMLYRAVGGGSWARAHCHLYNTAREYGMDLIALLQLAVLTVSLTSTLGTWLSLVRFVNETSVFWITAQTRISHSHGAIAVFLILDLVSATFLILAS